MEAKNILVATHTSEPVQPTRLYWKVTNLIRVRRAFGSLSWSGKPTKLSEVILRVFKLPHPATGVVP